MSQSHCTRAEEERIQKIQALAGLSTWEFDLASQEAHWSERFCLHLGWPQSEAESNLGWLRAHIHPENLDHFDFNWGEMLNTGILDVSLRIVRRDGEIRHVTLKGEVLEGQQSTLFAILQDDTQHKKVEGKLVELLDASQRQRRETRALLAGTRSLLEHQDFMLAGEQISRECQKLVASKAVCIVLLSDGGLFRFGNVVGSIQGEAIWQTPDLESHFQKAHDEGEFQLVRHVFQERCSGRHEHHLLIVPVIWDKAVVACLCLLKEEHEFSDADIRMASAFAELAAISLRNSSNLDQMVKLSAAVDQSGEGVVITDSSGRIEYLNPAEEQSSGFSLDDQVGTLCDLFTRASSGEPLYPTFFQAIQAGRDWRGEVTAQKSDGTFYQEERTVSPVRDQKGSITNFIIIKRDVTEKQQMEEQLRQSQKMEAIGTLAGGIAHDFNNILMAIIGFTEMAQKNLREDHKNQRYLQNVLDASHRAKELVRQILTFSRQQGQEKQPLQVDLVVKEALKLLNASLPATIEIRQNIQSQLKAVVADPAQIHQVVMNLGTNAAHAMRKSGGSLEVNLQQVRIDSVDESKRDLAPGEYLLLRVADTGHGMDSSVLKRVFEPFFTTKETDKGTGMGMAVVHGIVKDLKGDISVQSSKGEGTTVSVYLPVINRAPKQDKNGKDKLYRGRGRVLFVDDEQSLVDWARDTLHRLGYTVSATTSSLQALEWFQADPDFYDLVVTDLTMPRKTGRDVIVSVREHAPRVPVILCTGFSDDDWEEESERIKPTILLTKPFSMAEFSKAIASCMEEQKRLQTVIGGAGHE